MIAVEFAEVGVLESEGTQIGGGGFDELNGLRAGGVERREKVGGFGPATGGPDLSGCFETPPSCLAA